MTVRMAAVSALCGTFKNGKFIHLALDSLIEKNHFDERDRAFFTRLVYGTTEKKLTIDYCIAALSSVPMEKIQPMVLYILETGIYQLFFMDRVPASAVCNESTELVKRLCPGAYAGYVNAVLRAAVRKKDQLSAELRAIQGMNGVSVRHNIPTWICELWEKDYGDAERIAAGFEKLPPHITLRVNTMKTTASALLEKLPEDVKGRAVGEEILTLNRSVPVESLYGYEEGLFFVQDESSALCASLISPRTVGAPRPLIVDTCACPGGKTFAMAIQMKDECEIRAFDLHENRLPLIENGAKRLGLTSIRCEARDGRTPDETLFHKADAVLCDVPCSGLGVIAKKPDIRFKNREDIERLPSVQAEILRRSADYVKPGGCLVYSTCTLRKAENEDNVAAFLQENPAFTWEKLPYADGGHKTFFPHIDGTDGFFVALLRRKTEEA